MDASPLTRGKQWSAGSRALYCCAVCPPTCLGFLAPSLCGMCFRRCLISCGCNDAAPSLKSAGKAASIFFEGCGFAFPFGLGVAKHIQDTYVVDDSLAVYSISAGAFAALLLVLNMDPIEIINSKLERILVNFLDSTPCYGTFGTLSPIADALEDILPSDAHLICSGRLNIVISSWPCLGFHIVSTFPTRESLIQTVITSCTFPGFAWRPRCTNCPCEFDAGFQSILTPFDSVVDVTVRPMPILRSCLPSTLASTLHPVSDQDARDIGHYHAFESSLVPLGNAVWNGVKPIDFDQARELVEAACQQAATSPILQRAFDHKLKKKSEYQADIGTPAPHVQAPMER